MIDIKRVYEEPAETDGVRILVDRLWPRGLRKAEASIAAWVKEIAPSDGLRRWYAHAPERWDEFRRRYFEELDANRAAVEALRGLASVEKVTFVFASREAQRNNAEALREYLERARDR